jgi:ligand-binding sensor domain-containing protein
MHRRSFRVSPARALSAAVICAALACSTSATGPGGEGSGSLTITITTPTGVSPTVTVNGPSSYTKTLTATQTLSGLAPGSYTVTAGTATMADSIVSIAYAGVVTGSPAAVTAKTTATSTVTYSQPWSSSGVLWVANQLGNNVTGFTSSQLHSSGAPAPAVMVGSGTGSSTVQGASALAVDQTGGMWIADNTDTLYYYTPSQLSHGTVAAAAVKLISPALEQAVALAFDGQGDLWVADQATAKVTEFSAAQLATGGSGVTPPVILSASLGSISRPFSMAFDAHGDLWITNYGDSTIVGFSPSQLAATGSPLPFAGLSGSPGITNPISIAFDGQGDLWVATLFDTLSEFTPNQLTSIGAPTPAVLMTTPAIQEPQGMAFDNSGALWIADNQRSALVRYPTSQLHAGGTPSVTITKNGNSMYLPSWLAFSPHAPGLPVN